MFGGRSRERPFEISGIALAMPPVPVRRADAGAGAPEPQLEREVLGVQRGAAPKRDVLARAVELQAAAGGGVRRGGGVVRRRGAPRGRVGGDDDVVVGRVVDGGRVDEGRVRDGARAAERRARSWARAWSSSGRRGSRRCRSRCSASRSARRGCCRASRRGSAARPARGRRRRAATEARSSSNETVIGAFVSGAADVACGGRARRRPGAPPRSSSASCSTPCGSSVPSAQTFARSVVGDAPVACMRTQIGLAGRVREPAHQHLGADPGLGRADDAADLHEDRPVAAMRMFARYSPAPTGARRGRPSGCRRSRACRWRSSRSCRRRAARGSRAALRASGPRSGTTIVPMPPATS